MKQFDKHFNYVWYSPSNQKYLYGDLWMIDEVCEDLISEGLIFFDGIGKYYGERMMRYKFKCIVYKASREYIPVSVKREVFELCDYRCMNCGSGRRLEIDHIFPVSRGGGSELSNLQILCMTCNRAKFNH